MKSTSTQHANLMEQLAVVNARRQRDAYHDGFDQLLEWIGEGEADSLEEIRQLFVTYESPGMPSLSSDIESMREER